MKVLVARQAVVCVVATAEGLVAVNAVVDVLDEIVTRIGRDKRMRVVSAHVVVPVVVVVTVEECWKLQVATQDTIPDSKFPTFRTSSRLEHRSRMCKD